MKEESRYFHGDKVWWTDSAYTRPWEVTVLRWDCETSEYYVQSYSNKRETVHSSTLFDTEEECMAAMIVMQGMEVNKTVNKLNELLDIYDTAYKKSPKDVIEAVRAKYSSLKALDIHNSYLSDILDIDKVIKNEQL